MKHLLIIFFLITNFTAFSQNSNTLKKIDNYITTIDVNTYLTVTKHALNKVTKTQNTNKASLKIWKLENEIVKTEEKFNYKNGVLIRSIYLKDNIPVKAIETEENFKITEVNSKNINTDYKMEIYVIGFNETIEEFDFKVIEQGKRSSNEYYCDLNSVFSILSEIDDL